MLKFIGASAEFPGALFGAHYGKLAPLSGGWILEQSPLADHYRAANHTSGYFFDFAEASAAIELDARGSYYGRKNVTVGLPFKLVGLENDLKKFDASCGLAEMQAWADKEKLRRLPGWLLRERIFAALSLPMTSPRPAL